MPLRHRTPLSYIPVVSEIPRRALPVGSDPPQRPALQGKAIIRVILSFVRNRGRGRRRLKSRHRIRFRSGKKAYSARSQQDLRRAHPERAHCDPRRGEGGL